MGGVTTVLRQNHGLSPPKAKKTLRNRGTGGPFCFLDWLNMTVPVPALIVIPFSANLIKFTDRTEDPAAQWVADDPLS